ncbi:MAG: hypothetical protein HC769_21120 [Cyanobacteria bacterium CRU_2_1]|nr:hypothetical protein [Cyanobacteria bacterium CRU_2_1]
MELTRHVRQSAAFELLACRDRPSLNRQGRSSDRPLTPFLTSHFKQHPAKTTPFLLINHALGL